MIASSEAYRVIGVWNQESVLTPGGNADVYLHRALLDSILYLVYCVDMKAETKNIKRRYKVVLSLKKEFLHLIVCQKNFNLLNKIYSK